MGKLYDQSIFKQRDAALQQQAQSSNRLLIIAIVFGALVILAVAAWRWTHNPAKMIINVNAASVTELQYLPEVGPATAREIIAGRPFAKPEDLKKVKGIGEKTFEKMRPRVKVE